MEIFQKILLIVVLFFSGCAEKIQPEPKIIYIKQKVPKQNTLKTIKEYEITDIYTVNERYFGVNKKQLIHAADTAVMLRKQNYFYKKQAQDFNKLFVIEPMRSTIEPMRSTIESKPSTIESK